MTLPGVLAQGKSPETYIFLFLCQHIIMQGMTIKKETQGRVYNKRAPEALIILDFTLKKK